MKHKFITIAIICCVLHTYTFAQDSKTTDIQFVTIPSGSFYMGSMGYGHDFDEKPVHKVNITHSFRMSTTEITNAQYEQFDPTHRALRGKFGFCRNDDDPVIFVNYTEATDFCRWLSKKEGKTFRLPTEAEWEYACRAGTYSLFCTGDGLPAEMQKNQKLVCGRDSSVNLKVAQTQPNTFGLYDMHGNVEEWCLDWYAPYSADEQTNPGGAKSGLYRVTRGGSHSTFERYLRSANRLAMIPEDKSWLTGFRIVESETTPILSDIQQNTVNKSISQQKYNWTPNEEPFFAEPIVYVREPDCADNVPFYRHNHCPAITWCDNGDMLVCWFSADEESGREMTILSSRLPAGSNEWIEAKEFLRIPDRNLTGSSLFNDGNGRLIHTNGIEVAGYWQNLAIMMRTSDDNGATWSNPRLIAAEHDVRHQVIAGMFRTNEGWFCQAADATPQSNGGTALHISKDNGKTWFDAGDTSFTDDFREGGKGHSIAGIHAGVVQLKNGDFLALGRGDAIKNKDNILRMPMSRSTDGGKTWTYSASEFPPIDGGQRLVLKRLNEGALLFISFTNHPYRLKNGLNGMTFTRKNGETYTGYGMYAALSFDEGKTWPIKKLLTDGKHRFLNGGAWTGFFEMDMTHAEPRGYLAVTQSPDGTIHLVSSRIHYRFNLAWLTK